MQLKVADTVQNAQDSQRWPKSVKWDQKDRYLQNYPGYTGSVKNLQGVPEKALLGNNNWTKIHKSELKMTFGANVGHNKATTQCTPFLRSETENAQK